LGLPLLRWLGLWHTVKTTIGRLRVKLGDPPVIETLRDSGYRIGGS